ncbi:---NA---, partial [Paramuricea clavata]
AKLDTKHRSIVHLRQVIVLDADQDVYVKFNPTFRTIPKVMIGLTLVDTHEDQNVRVRVRVGSVTKGQRWILAQIPAMGLFYYVSNWRQLDGMSMNVNGT